MSFYLVEPFPATLHDDFNVFFDTVVFAHENSNTVLPVTLEQCWAAQLMSRNAKTEQMQAAVTQPSGYMPRAYMI